MSDIIFTRNCPTCPKIISYSSIGNYNVAVKNNCRCKSCGHTKDGKPKIIKDKPIKDKKNHYWTDIQENAIVNFIKSTSQVEKDNIYNVYLKDAFQKMVSSIYHLNATRCLSFVNYYGSPEAGIHEGVCKLLEILDTFNPTKGKFYSYGTFCLNRHYKLINSQIVYRQSHNEPLCNVTSQGIDEDNDTRIELSTHDKLHESIDLKEYLGLLTQVINVRRNKICRSKIQKKALVVLLESLKNADLLGEPKMAYFKYAVDNGVSTPQFTYVLMKIKKLHRALFKEYKNTGTVDLTKKYQF